MHWALVPLVDSGGGERLDSNPTTGTNHEQKPDLLQCCPTVSQLSMVESRIKNLESPDQAHL